MKERVPLSCCVITYNEEDTIADCLESISWADEILVVDSHSTDRTVEIARQFTDMIIENDFEGHIQQKNFALEHASNQWVLCIDADERVTPELSGEIQKAMEAPGDESGFSMPRLTWYLGRFIRHGGWYPDRKIRLFRKDRGTWGGRNPHDHVNLEGTAVALSGNLLHYTYRDIADHLRKMNSFTDIASDEMEAEGRRVGFIGLLLRPPLRFLKMYVFKLGFLDGLAGLVIASLGSFYVFLKYAKLWQKGKQSK